MGTPPSILCITFRGVLYCHTLYVGRQKNTEQEMDISPLKKHSNKLLIKIVKLLSHEHALTDRQREFLPVLNKM